MGSPISSMHAPTLTTLVLALLLGCCAAAAAPEWQVSLQRAVSLHQGGDLPGSSIHYGEALKLNPDLRRSWPVLTNYALSLQSSAPAEAAEIFREVIQLAPGADAYFNLGNALVDVAAERALLQTFGTAERHRAFVGIRPLC